MLLEDMFFRCVTIRQGEDPMSGDDLVGPRRSWLRSIALKAGLVLKIHPLL